MIFFPSSIIYGPQYMGYRIQASFRAGCYESILIKVARIFNEMILRHKRVRFLMFAVHVPGSYAYPNGNEIFYRFLGAFIKELAFRGISLMYAWVYSGYGHRKAYQLALWVDGDERLPSGTSILERGERIWGQALGISRVKGNLVPNFEVGEGIVLDQRDPAFHEKADRCFYLASFLALTTTKGHAPGSSRSFGSSKVPGVMPDDV